MPADAAGVGAAGATGATGAAAAPPRAVAGAAAGAGAGAGVGEGARGVGVDTSARCVGDTRAAQGEEVTRCMARGRVRDRVWWWRVAPWLAFPKPKP